MAKQIGGVGPLVSSTGTAMARVGMTANRLRVMVEKCMVAKCLGLKDLFNVVKNCSMMSSNSHGHLI